MRIAKDVKNDQICALTGQFGLHLPSPIEKIHSTLFHPAQEIYVKRDDLIHPYMMGNKWRKLLPYICRLKEESYDTVLSAGGLHSNHLLSLAYVCAQLKLNVHFLIRGEYPSGGCAGNFLLLQKFRPKISYVNRSDFRKWRHSLRNLQETYSKKGQRALIVPEGGSGTAEEGFRLFFEEFNGEHFDFFALPMGTGGTFARIYNLNEKYGLFKHVVGYPVVKMSPADWLRELRTLDYRGDEASILFNPKERGFAKISKETLRFSRDFIAETGIMIDPYYSGKLLHYLAAGTNQIRGRICFYHTGGLWGAASRDDLFAID